MTVRILLLLLLLAACGPNAREVASGDEMIELKFGHVGQPGSLFAVSAEAFARKVNETAGGSVRVRVFGSSQLGGDDAMLQKLKLGTLDFSLPSTIMSSTVDEFGLFDMPYLVEDREHMQRIETAIFWPRLAPLVEPKGYKIIAVWENGFRHVTNNVRPIVTPSDLKGIKLRTPRGRWRVRMFQAYGANPTPMPLAEVFVALETGVIDGQENPFAQIYTSNLHEVQDYISLTSHVYTPAYVTVGLDAWRRLPADARAIVTAAARDVQSFVYATAERMDQEFLQAIRDAGAAVNETDRAGFLEASGPIYRAFEAEVPVGRALIGEALALRSR